MNLKSLQGQTKLGQVRAAQAKGLSAAGMRLSIDELKPDNIVHVTIDGTPHYSVVREVTENSVKLADPSLGNIEMSREKFCEIFTGNTLVINVPQEVNQPAEHDASSAQVETLTDEEMEIINGQQLSASANMQLSAETMQSIKGKGRRRRVQIDCMTARRRDRRTPE